MSFRLELFVDDLAASIDFYSRAPGFIHGKQQPDGYTLVTHQTLTLSLNLRANLPEDHPIQANNDEWRICFRFVDGDAYDVEVCDYH